MGQRRSLEQIKIAEPCHASWDAMTGDAQKRFCDSCGKHVHDLSTLTREEAEALVNGGESVCIRMQRDAHGTVRTKTSPVIERRFPPRWMRAAASVAAMRGITSVFGCKPESDAPLQGSVPIETPQVKTMGLVALPPEMGDIETIQGDIGPSTQPAEPGAELGMIAPPTTQPLQMPKKSTPTTQPAEESIVIGRLVAPATAPAKPFTCISR